MKFLFFVVFLISTISFSQEMTSNPYVPLSQPFNDVPWHYNGDESVDSLPSNTVDWLLLELREDIISGTQNIIYRTAVILTTTGSIITADGDILINYNDISGYYYLVIHQRNHLPVMSVDPLLFMEGFLAESFDFTKPYNVYGDTLAVIKLDVDLYGMISGDADNNGVVNVLDYAQVQNNLFAVGYNPGDIDNNGVINVLDYGHISSNLFRVSQVPNGIISTPYLTSTPTSYPVSSDSGTSVFNISSNISFWSITAYSPWLTPSLLNGSNDEQLSVQYELNLFPVDRTGLITIVGDAIVIVDTIYQEAYVDTNIYNKLTIIDAIAKDTSQATTLPWRAYDGVTYTGDENEIWTSQPIPEWIYFELDDIKDVKKLMLSFSYWHSGRVYGYSVEYSDDAINWTTSIPNANSIANQEWVTQIVSFSAKYVRVSFSSNSQSEWAGFYEVEIFSY